MAAAAVKTECILYTVYGIMYNEYGFDIPGALDVNEVTDKSEVLLVILQIISFESS